jgi:hypothetical protein
MSKNQTDLFIVILFSIILIVHPISYDEMRSQHPIYPKENVVLIKNSSIPTQNDELEFLKSNPKEIILAKDTSKSFFAEALTQPLPIHPSSIGSQTATGMSGQNPDQGGNPDSGSESGSC